MLNTHSWMLYVIGYTFATFGAGPVVGYAVRKLWSIADEDFKLKAVYVPSMPVRPASVISFWHGVTERAVYVTCVVLGKPEGIAVWLAFKAVMRWKVSEDPDPRHVPGSLIFMIGTAMNVAFGLVGGFVALGRWSF
jgi:hypothetical protein